MKRYLIFLLLFGLIAAFIAAPTTISAKGPVPPTPKPEVWELYSEGVAGEEIPMYTITTAPREWLQLKANGLKVDGATKICHGFDAGRYGWTGEIFRLVGDAWVKLPTTVGWVPTEEGSYMACAIAPAAGTYALFGYFDLAKAPVVENVLPLCESYDTGFYGGYDNPPTFYDFYAIIGGLENANVPFTYVITNSNYQISGDVTATVLSNASGYADFSDYQWQILVLYSYPITFTIHMVTPSCYFDWDVTIFPNGNF